MSCVATVATMWPNILNFLCRTLRATVFHCVVVWSHVISLSDRRGLLGPVETWEGMEHSGTKGPDATMH